MSKFASHKNTTVSAAILWPVACVSDIKNKADMCGKSIQYIMSWPFPTAHQ